MLDPDVKVVGSLTWLRWQEIPAVCLAPRNLRSTLAVAAVVGTLLVLINQADVVLGGGFGPRFWLKAGLTYLVPFLVSNYGLVVGSRRNSG
jgi:hypothetical protein